MIGGKKFPMEAHFVHRNEAGGLAVVGVLMAEGKPNAPSARSSRPCRRRKGPR